MLAAHHQENELVQSARQNAIKGGLLEPTAENGRAEVPEEVIESLLLRQEHGRAARMLAGCAIENLLKAVIVRQRTAAGTQIVDQDGSLTDIPRTHDLVTLFRIAHVGDLTIDDEQLLDSLSHSVRWAGRYPVALRAVDGNTRIRAGGYFLNTNEMWHRVAARIIAQHDAINI